MVYIYIYILLYYREILIDDGQLMVDRSHEIPGYSSTWLEYIVGLLLPTMGICFLTKYWNRPTNLGGIVTMQNGWWSLFKQWLRFKKFGSPSINEVVANLVSAGVPGRLHISSTCHHYFFRMYPESIPKTHGSKLLAHGWRSPTIGPTGHRAHQGAPGRWENDDQLMAEELGGTRIDLIFST